MKGEQEGQDDPSSHSASGSASHSAGSSSHSSGSGEADSAHGASEGASHGSSQAHAAGEGSPDESHASAGSHDTDLGSHNPAAGGHGAGDAHEVGKKEKGGKTEAPTGPAGARASRSPNALGGENELMTSQTVFVENQPYTLLLNNQESLLCQTVAWGPHHDVLECKLRGGASREIAPAEVSALKRGWD